MTVNSRAARRERRRTRIEGLFGSDAAAALDLLELTELAWHDCYDESSPSEDVVEDILAVSEARLDLLVSAAWLAVTDYRDLRCNADAVRARTVGR